MIKSYILVTGAFMKLRLSSYLFGMFLLIAYLPMAEAHTFGAHGMGLTAGFAHPFFGIDHVLAMIAVGMWASQLGGKSIVIAPLAFVIVMAGSAYLGALGVALPELEPAIACSVLVLGLLIAFAVRVSTLTSVCLVGLFAVFHGLAHGLELPQTATPMLYAVGFVSATVMLHGAGIAMGISARHVSYLFRLGGSLIALTGLFLLATT